MVVASTTFNSCYDINWGNSLYFHSFENNCHRFASSSLLIIILCLILCKIKNRKVFLLLTIVPIIGIFLSGARIYLMLCISLCVIAFYYLFDNKKKFCIYFILMCIILTMTLFATPIFNKFKYVLRDGFNFSNFMNGRDIF